jgi:hypothetical protein
MKRALSVDFCHTARYFPKWETATDLAEENVAGSSPNEFDALQAIISALLSLDSEARQRILESAATFLRIGSSRNVAASSAGHPLAVAVPAGPSAPNPRSPFSKDSSMSAKDFLTEKAPKTDVERIACLAYYLTHYRSTPHFKTLDLSLLNTEAAQPKF